MDIIPRNFKAVPPVKDCPYCGCTMPCLNQMCDSHYMYGDKNTPQLGDEDCKDYFQPLDFNDE